VGAGVSKILAQAQRKSGCELTDSIGGPEEWFGGVRATNYEEIARKELSDDLRPQSVLP
jgi:hypothetical protein